MNLKQRQALVTALLACPSLNDRDRRKTVINDLSNDIKSNIARNNTDKVEVMNIVTACLNYPNGLQELTEIMAFYEGDSLPFQIVKQLIANHQSDTPPIQQGSVPLQTLPEPSTNTITRHNLIDQLLRDITTKKLTAIIAPAGYGKTTLLVDAVHQAELPVCWYAIDNLSGNTLQRFALHLVEAIKLQFPEFGEQSLAYIRSNPDLNTTSLLTLFINDLYSQITHHFIIVVDDFHLIPTNSDITEFVGHLIHTMTTNCHFIIASRQFLRLPDMARLLASRTMAVLFSSDLKFSPDEVKSLFLRDQKYLSDTEAETLVSQAEGWITGIILVERTGDDGEVNVGVYDYLADQVLIKQKPMIQDFLYRSSLLGEFDVVLCRAVFGHGEWFDLIEQIKALNLFTVQVGEHLRYHHQFEDFLQWRMMNSRPDESGEILRKLAKVHEVAGQWTEAHEVLRRVGDVGALAEFIERVGQGVVDAGHTSLLEKWIYNSCFISYNNQDQPFAQRLYDDLQDSGVDCWLGIKDMRPGDVIINTIDKSIRVYDKMLVILSKNSIDSDWVGEEVSIALDRERKYKEQVLFPIRLDETVMDLEAGWAASIRANRHIGDFTRWDDEGAYVEAFKRLLEDLRVDD